MKISSCIRVAVRWHYFIFYGLVAFHVYLYHVFFTHLSVDGHLGCFHVLAIVNSIIMNIWLRVSFLVIICLNKCPGVGLLDHMLILFLVF